MDLVPILERMVGVRPAAVHDEEHGPIIGADGEVVQHEGERRPGRDRDVEMASRPLRGLALQRGVQSNGDYQLKTLSRSASAVS